MTLDAMRRVLFQTFLFALSLMLLQGCSCSGNKNYGLEVKLASSASENSEFILVCNLSDLLEECNVDVTEKGLMISPMLRNFLNRDFSGEILEKVIEVAESLEGVDLTDIVFVGSPSGECVGVFGVDDFNDFVDSLRKVFPALKEFDIDGFSGVAIEGILILVKESGLGFVVSSETEEAGVHIVNDFEESAGTSPLSQWKKDYLAENKDLKLLINTGFIRKEWKRKISEELGTEVLTGGELESLIPGDYYELTVDLDGPELKVKTANIDKNGLTVSASVKSKFKSELIEYSLPTDFLAVSVSMTADTYKNVGEGLSHAVNTLMVKSTPYYEEQYVRRMVDATKRFFKELTQLPAEYLAQGGMFVAFGLAEDFSIDEFSLDALDDLRTWHFVFAADVRSEKSGEAYKGVCDIFREIMQAEGVNMGEGENMMMKFSVPDTERYDYTKLEWVVDYIDFYVALHGDTLLVSNSLPKRNSNPVFNKEIFEGTGMAFQVVISGKNIEIIRQLGITEGLEVTGSSTWSTSNYKVKILNTNDKIIPATINLLSRYGL